MRGLRTTENEKTIKFFQIVQSAAAELNAVFFAYAAEDRIMETEELSGSDISGWLIPQDKADEFEKKFMAYDDLEEWAEEFFLFAKWELVEGEIIINFYNYGYFGD